MVEVIAITLGTFAAAHFSIVVCVVLTTSSWMSRLLRPRTKPPFTPLEAMAHCRPCFFSVSQCSGPINSTDLQPSSFATSQSRSALHLSPVLM